MWLILCERSIWDDDKAHPRVTGVPMLKLRLDTVRVGAVSNPSEGESPAAAAAAAVPTAPPAPPLVEYRIHAAALPLRVIVSYEVLAFFMGLANAAAEEEANVAGSGAPEPPVAAASSSAFLQFVDIRALKLNIDYEPSPVDRAALMGGDMKQLMNLVRQRRARDGVSDARGRCLLMV